MSPCDAAEGGWIRTRRRAVHAARRRCRGRPPAMRRLLFEGLTRRPLTEPPPRIDDPEIRGAGGRARRGGAEAARPQPVDPRGRCRLVQRLRARDPRAQQRLLRSRALRPPYRRLAPPCRRADGDRAGDEEHARGAAAHLRRHPGAEMGGGGGRLRAGWRAVRRLLRGGGRGRRGVAASTSTSPAARRRRRRCSRAC